MVQIVVCVIGGLHTFRSKVRFARCQLGSKCRTSKPLPGSKALLVCVKHASVVTPDVFLYFV